MRTAWHPGLAVNLFLENLNVHKSRGIVEKFSLAGIILLFFPAGFTHVIKPLDKFPYAIFKGKLEFWTRKVTFHLKNAGLEANDIRIVATINVLHEAMTSKAIQASFRLTGIYPFSIDVIQECARKAWGRPLSYEQIEVQHYGRAQKVQRNVREIWELLEEQSKNFVDATLDGAAETINVNLNVGTQSLGSATKSGPPGARKTQNTHSRSAKPEWTEGRAHPDSARRSSPAAISGRHTDPIAHQQSGPQSEGHSGAQSGGSQAVLELAQLPRRGLECIKCGRRVDAEIRGAAYRICKEWSLCCECGSLRVEAHQSEGEERNLITCTHQKVLNAHKERCFRIVGNLPQ